MPPFVTPEGMPFLSVADFQTEIQVAAPAVATNPSFSPSGNQARFQVLAIQCTLVTDANAANRRVVCRVRSSNIDFIVALAGDGAVAQVASKTVSYVASTYPTQMTVITADTLTIGMPYLPIIDQGWTVSFTTTNIQAGDQWAEFNLLTLAVEP